MASDLRAGVGDETVPQREARSASTADGPVYVDLDGTLIATDMLWETLLQLLCNEPTTLVRMPFWLMLGKSGFKDEIAGRVSFDAALLPYREPVLRYLEEQKQRGRRLILATASHQSIAHRIAEHLGIFDVVLASDRNTNLSADHKRESILRDCGGERFEYLGNSSADLPIWSAASAATLVAPTRGARGGIPGTGTEWKELAIEEPAGTPALSAMRIYQWIKNGLLFVPILLAHAASDIDRLLSVATLFVSFCAVASATYILNDLLDIASDRQHQRKKHRPFAAGTLPIPNGIALSAALLGFGFLLSGIALPPMATAMLGIYTLLTVTYSFYLKERLFIDVLMLGGLYTHRVLSGAVAADVRVSPWLLAFSLFLFLSLALLKRYAELLAARDKEDTQLARRAYQPEDLGLVESMGLTSGYMSVLVLCLFVSSADVSKLYPTPDLLWLVPPIFLYWIARMWFLARRRILSDDPVLFAATDRTSYLTGVLIGVVGILAAW